MFSVMPTRYAAAGRVPGIYRSSGPLRGASLGADDHTTYFSWVDAGGLGASPLGAAAAGGTGLGAAGADGDSDAAE